jgi:K+-transporting ATPase ATPase B chain
VAQISLWLWFTVIFANFAEAMAEGRGKAQADTLRKSRTKSVGRKLLPNGKIETVAAESLRKGDIFVVTANELIAADGEIIEGAASVNESAITGESAPVIREAGGDRSAVTGGTTVLSDEIKVRVTADPGESFMDRMIELIEGAKRQKTPNEIALSILLAGLTIIFLIVTITLMPFVLYTHNYLSDADFTKVQLAVSITVLIALLVCLIPTTIGGLLSAIGIAGIDRMVQHNVLAMSGKAVEAAGDVDVLLLDKTGTITLGNRAATEFLPAPGVTEQELAECAQLSSLADETPEGRSIVILAKEKFGIRARELSEIPEAEFVPFTAQTRMSGVNMNGSSIRKGAAANVRAFVLASGAEYPIEVDQAVEKISRVGGTPLVVATAKKAMGVVYLKDIVKQGLPDRFQRFRAMGIKTVMITGDNPLTAAAIAKEAGVDDFLAQATPEDKLALLKKEQASGHMVAMTGDGTNDAPALAQADVGVAMNTGTQAAKEAGNMVDLDSNPTKLIEVVEIGKQLLMTRGALTTFSVANDVAKYFAIIPAMLMGAFPAVAPLNIMKLASPHSAVLSAVIFNAIIIVLLIPLALRGVKFRPASAAIILRRNLLVYGLGGIICPFPGIWLIDLMVRHIV